MTNRFEDFYWDLLYWDTDQKVFFKLLLFLNASKDDIERSSKWVHVYYKLKRGSPEFFKNRDVLSNEIQSALKNQLYLTLPVTPDGCNVIMHGLISHDPKKYVFDEAIKTFIMTTGEFTRSLQWLHLRLSNQQRHVHSKRVRGTERFLFMIWKAWDLSIFSDPVSARFVKASTFCKEGIP